ncbi:MAG: DUF2147 domain-containing protein [Rhodobacteraceae bacterium]|nr:DUF2147 domain-containing protein [Paracoccaceae bacterium]MCP5341993.1 DUF2147 domain-containing protein [Paracoccaceae bacterium]
MKRFLFAAALVFAAGGAMADPIEGVWQTKPDDNGKFGFVRIAPCGAKICGVLVKAFDSSGAETPSDNIGKQIVWGMVPSGGGTYSGGSVWAPDRDKTYRGKMQLSGDDLAVSGCVLGGLICRASDWRRVK